MCEALCHTAIEYDFKPLKYCEITNVVGTLLKTMNTFVLVHFAF